MRLVPSFLRTILPFVRQFPLLKFAFVPPLRPFYPSIPLSFILSLEQEISGIVSRGLGLIRSKNKDRNNRGIWKNCICLMKFRNEEKMES